MFLELDYSSAKPLYQQLIDQVKFAVASGRLKSGDRLPPIRDLAVQIRMNRNTIARVYSELEREGIVYNRTGQGCFVSDRGSSLSRAEQRRQITGRMDEIIAQARLFDLTRDQLIDLFMQRVDGIYQNNGDHQK